MSYPKAIPCENCGETLLMHTFPRETCPKFAEDVQVGWLATVYAGARYVEVE